MSIIAIGNQLHYPKGQFPAWVHEHEHDPLFWVSGTDGMSLLQKISGAVGLLIVVVFSEAWHCPIVESNVRMDSCRLLIKKGNRSDKLLRFLRRVRMLHGHNVYHCGCSTDSYCPSEDY